MQEEGLNLEVVENVLSLVAQGFGVHLLPKDGLQIRAPLVTRFFSQKVNTRVFAFAQHTCDIVIL